MSKSTTPTIPDVLYAEVSVKSLGGTSIFDEKQVIASDIVDNFYSNEFLVEEAISELGHQGFEVSQAGDATLTIGAPTKTYEETFKTKIVAEERPVIKPGLEETTATFMECPDTKLQGLISTKGSSFENLIEGIAINEPVYFMGTPSAFPPPKAYWHLDVPGDVSLGMRADRAHRLRYTGKGIDVVMVDSGWYRHPFFTQRGYRSQNVLLGPSASNPTHDESGHGTGESANVFAVAPDVNFRMVKINFVNSVGAFNAAVGLNPDIISCSWGISTYASTTLSASQRTQAAAIASAVRRGIIVVFSAGNGHIGFPGQHPDVISAGGTYMHEDGSLEASDYSSGFESLIYSGRKCPDVCGLVGMKPGASYIMLPLEPGDAIDVSKSGGTHPPGDETARDDGWAAFSGTSAAAPQIAGVCALMKQACRRLSPRAARRILQRTARDVTTGNSNTSSGGHPAQVGRDLATGFGLADAYRAARSARLACFPVRWPWPIRPVLTPRPIPRPIPRPVLPPRPGPRPVSEDYYEAEFDDDDFDIEEDI